MNVGDKGVAQLSNPSSIELTCQMRFGADGDGPAEALAAARQLAAAGCTHLILMADEQSSASSKPRIPADFIVARPQRHGQSSASTVATPAVGLKLLLFHCANNMVSNTLRLPSLTESDRPHFLQRIVRNR